MAAKKILIISHKAPYPKVDGGAIAISQTIEGLSNRNHKLWVLSMETEKHPSEGVENTDKLNYKGHKVITKIKALDALLNLVSRESYILSRFDQSSFEKELIGLLNSEEFDCIILESLFTSSYLNTIRRLSNAKLIYRSHNIEHLIWKRYSGKSKNILKSCYLKLQAKRLEKAELAFWNKVDAIASISSEDSKIMQSHTQTRILNVPVYADNEKLKMEDSSNTLDFFHLGSMDWLPNKEGIDWLLKNVWPEVTKMAKDAELYIAGRNMPSKLLNISMKGYNNKGSVANADEFMCSHKVMLVPLFSASGMRVKIVEAMALGKCIITTSIGAEGIPYKHLDNLIIANTAEEFIQMILYCINNSKEVDRIADRARETIKDSFSQKVIMGTFERLLED